MYVDQSRTINKNTLKIFHTIVSFLELMRN
jgi:hypothetical protein